MENLDKNKLLYLIDCYNSYIVEFYDNHTNDMIPVSLYEFFDNEFQEIMESEE